MDMPNIGVRLSNDLLTEILSTNLFCDNQKIKEEIIDLNEAGNIFAIKQLISSYANQEFLNILLDTNVNKIDTPEEFEYLHNQFFEQYNSLLKRIDSEINTEQIEKTPKTNKNGEPNGPVNL